MKDALGGASPTMDVDLGQILRDYDAKITKFSAVPANDNSEPVRPGQGHSGTAQMAASPVGPK